MFSIISVYWPWQMKTHIEIIAPFSIFDVHLVSLIWHIFSLTSTVIKTAESSMKSVIFCLITSSTSWWLQEDGTQSAQWISDVFGITWFGCGSKKLRIYFEILKKLFYVFKLASVRFKGHQTLSQIAQIVKVAWHWNHHTCETILTPEFVWIGNWIQAHVKISELVEISVQDSTGKFGARVIHCKIVEP